jgi:nucleotide-binding universal stress UspA family protein
VIESDERSKARRAALERECASVGGSEPPRSVLLEGPHVVDEVLAHAERSGAELVALSTHGSGGWKSALLGSVTSKLMRSSRVPLFLVPVRSESTAR